MPSHSAVSVANLYVRHALDKGYPLTLMPLIKFIYFAHGWTLGYTGQPLIREDIIAWRIGPAIPEVYRAFHNVKGFIIGSEVEGEEFNSVLSDEERELAINVFDDYSQQKVWTLSQMAVSKEAPWYKYRRKRGSVIPNSLIEAYYKSRVN